MSRDPDDHSPMSPSDLQKYLYADADPVDMDDPSGRDAGNRLDDSFYERDRDSLC